MAPKRKSDKGGGGTAPSTAAAKRQRVSRACDQCRAAREKCDGIQPMCFPCVSQNRACTYDTNPKKRGVQTGYIRALEIALAWVLNKSSGSEDALNNLLAHEGGQGGSILVGTASGSGNRLHQRWLKGPVCAEIDRILSGGEPRRGARSKGAASDDSPDADDAPEGLEGSYSEEHPARSPSRSTPPSAVIDLVPGNASDHLHDDASRYKLPYNHWDLLDVYFSYTHSWFPVVEKHDILKVSYEYPDSGLDLSVLDPASAPHAELWAVLAIASCQRCGPSTQSRLYSIMDPKDVYQKARGLIPFENGPFSIHQVRALLLLCLVNLGGDNVSAAWILVGHAVRIALDLGLGWTREEASWTPSQRRVSMGCFILDTLVARRMNRSPHLISAMLPEDMVPSIENVEEWQPWKSYQGFGSDAHLQEAGGPPCPVQASSTFNILYGLCEYLSQSSLPNLGRSLPGVTLHVEEMIDARYRYRSFVLAGRPPPPLPSPYVIRLIYLAAQACTGRSPVPLPAILDHLEAYISRHGTTAASPLFTTCLALAQTGGGGEAATIEGAARLGSISAALKEVWERGNPPSTVPSGFRQVVVATPAVQSGHHPTLIPGDPSALQMAPTFADVYCLPTPVSPFLVRDAGAAAFDGSHLYGDQDRPTSQHAVGTGLDGPVGDLPNSAVAVPSFATPLVPMLKRPSWTDTSTDYEALLDDLACMDYTNQADADSRFMMNLGFAPGADLTEFLSREFGVIPELSRPHILETT